MWANGGPDVTPVKGFSAPGATFAFEVVVPQPLPANPADGTSFDYVLDNKGIIDEFLSPHVPVQFFDALTRVCSICSLKKMMTKAILSSSPFTGRK